MGEAYRGGERLGEATGPTKADVLEQLERKHPDADEIRLRSASASTARGVSAHSPLSEKIDTLFSYHAPKGDQPKQYEEIRAAAKAFAQIILANTPAGADQTTAIRKLRECVQTANASIALEGVA